MVLMRVTIEWPAGPHERFRPGAIPVGGQVPVVLYDSDDEPGPCIGAGTIIAADVSDDGRSVHLTIDITAPEGSQARPDAGPDALRRVLRLDSAELHKERGIVRVPSGGSAVLHAGSTSATVEGDAPAIDGVAICGARITTAEGTLICERPWPCPNH